MQAKGLPTIIKRLTEARSIKDDRLRNKVVTLIYWHYAMAIDPILLSPVEREQVDMPGIELCLCECARHPRVSVRRVQSALVEIGYSEYRAKQMATPLEKEVETRVMTYRRRGSVD